MMPSVYANTALLGTDYVPADNIRIAHDDGVITAVDAVDAPVADGPRRLLMPCFANAHDHGRPLPTLAFGAIDQPLETWLLRLAVAPSVDPYLAACVSFGRAALGGSGAVMMHCTRAQGLTDLPTEVREVARAADAVGIRVAFAVALRDRNPLVYGDDSELQAGLDADARAAIERYFALPHETAAEAIARVEDCAQAAQGTGLDVQYGPTGVQWCSDTLLRAIARASADTGRRVHIHLLETRYQRAWADRQYPQGIVRHLADIGLLGPRLTLAHCVWACDEELELIAESGATIAVNTSSNLHLRSGIAPLRRMLDAGCRVALGLDGCALDQDDDAVREMRLARLLHSERGFETRPMHADLLRCALDHGRASVGAPSHGRLEPGQSADWVSFDLDRLDHDCLTPVDSRALLFARASADYIDEVRVAGRTIVQSGRLQTIDLPAYQSELLANYRRAWHDRCDLQAAWPQIETAIGEFYDRIGCC